MIILITGTPGSGKTLWAVKLIRDWVKEGRNVYSDIDGLSIDGVLPIPDTTDWTQTPKGSVVVFDETQKHDVYQYKGKEKLSKAIQITGLETARHDGYDIVFITQSPKFLHNHLLDLVGLHYHVYRAYGRQRAEVYVHRKVQIMPNTPSSVARAEDHIKFSYDKTLFDLYHSAEVHTHKLQIPSYFYKAIGGLILICCFIAYMVFGTNNKFLSVNSLAASAEQLENDSNKTPQVGVTTGAVAATTNAQQQQPQQPATLKYDPTKPYEVDYTQLQRSAAQLPQFSGCMQLQTKCKCYTQQGTSLDVSIADCKRVISGDMPFNPFVTRDSIQQSPIQQTEVSA